MDFEENCEFAKIFWTSERSEDLKDGACVPLSPFRGVWPGHRAISHRLEEKKFEKISGKLRENH